MQKNITAKAPKIGHLHITRKKGVCGRDPIIAGTRTPVRSIACYYKMGMTADEILDVPPHPGPAEVYDALAYYFDNQEEIEKESEENSEEVLMKKYTPGKY